jgi:predicted nucleic acid-binding protein
MICVDASVAAKWLIQEEWSEQALDLFLTASRSNVAIVAPPVFPIEVTNALWKRVRFDTGLSLAEATVQLERLLSLQIITLDPPGLLQRALMIADAFNLPAVYDAHYLALSEWLGCEFWTDDQRLLTRVRRDLPFVRWIGNYQRT